MLSDGEWWVGNGLESRKGHGLVHQVCFGTVLCGDGCLDGLDGLDCRSTGSCLLVSRIFIWGCTIKNILNVPAHLLHTRTIKFIRELERYWTFQAGMPLRNILNQSRTSKNSASFRGRVRGSVLPHLWLTWGVVGFASRYPVTNPGVARYADQLAFRPWEGCFGLDSVQHLGSSLG